jgi:3-methyladenine DNA glycosylase AlkD
MPTRVATTILARLTETYEAHRDPAQAAPMEAYMRGQFPFIGLKQADQSRLNRQILGGTGQPTEADLTTLARRCWQRPEREYQYFAVGYLRRWVPTLPASPGFLTVVEPLITTKSWWDTIDALAQHVVGPLVTTYPKLQATMDDWVIRDNLWLARTAILHQCRYKDRTDTDRLFGYCLARAGDSEFFVRKSIGWALREYSKTDATAVRTFVTQHAGELSPLSRREALKWLDRRAPENAADT